MHSCGEIQCEYDMRYDEFVWQSKQKKNHAMCCECWKQHLNKIDLAFSSAAAVVFFSLAGKWICIKAISDTITGNAHIYYKFMKSKQINIKEWAKERKTDRQKRISSNGQIKWTLDGRQLTQIKRWKQNWLHFSIRCVSVNQYGSRCVCR